MKQPLIVFAGILLAVLMHQAASAQGDYVANIYPVALRENLTAASSEAMLKRAVLTVSRMKGDSDLQLKDITKVTFFKSATIKGIGKMSIFSVEYSDTLPMVYDPVQYLFADNLNHRYFLITLSEVKLIRAKAGDKNYYLGGIYKRRGYGVLKIFKWSGKAMDTVFTSPDWVSNDSYDCISYRHKDLAFENADLNHDGYLDLHFHGIANYYCNGGENLGKMDRKPLRSKPITITYYFNAAKKNWYKKQ